MFTIDNLVQPETLEEAYKILTEKRNNTILGGCAYLRLGSQRIGTAVDLSKMNLNFIKEQDEYIALGCMTTFRDVEISPVLHEYFGGVLPKAVSNVVGVQFRNIVTVGASVYARYGFSDLITPLLALDTEVQLYRGGRMSLEMFLNKPLEKDILATVFIKKSAKKAAYQHLRKSASDYPILNVAVSNLDNQWIIAVGARPQRAAISRHASEELSKGNMTNEKIDHIASLVAEELSYGTNMRGNAEYRKAISKVLVKRAISEVLQWK
ncbi:MAG: FAD-binding protein [Firmicutes bacterium]|nr:FAD-binding protein [Bacillota bacterium]